MVLLAALLLAIPAQARLWNWADTPQFVSTSGLLGEADGGVYDEYTTLVSWEKGETTDADGTWTAIGDCSLEYTSKYNKNTTSVKVITFTSSITSGGEWKAALKLTGDFKAGDVITIQPFTQMNAEQLATKWATIVLYGSDKKQIANLTGATDVASKAVTDGHEEEGEPAMFSYVLENDYTELYFGRSGNTRINLMKVCVERASAAEDDALVVVPETAEVQAWTLTGQTVGSSSANYDYPTEVAFDGNDVYVKGLFPYVKDTWAKGTIADGKATFKAGQLIGDFDGVEKYYLLGSEDGETICDIVLAYDAEAKTLTQETQYIYLNYNKKNEINPEYLESWQNLKLTFGIEEPVTPPEGLETAARAFNTSFYYSETESEAYEGEVQVSIDGDDIYVQGIAPNAPQLWIKASKNVEGQYVVPALQYMGETSGWRKFKCYIAALDAEDAFTNLVFTYDEAAGKLVTEQKFVINNGKAALSPLQTFAGTTTIALTVSDGPFMDALVVVPETATQEDWTIEGALKSSWSNKPVQRATKVAFDGNDIYLQGFFDYTPTTWVKGTIADGKATFAAGQLINVAEGEKYYFLGSNDGETICDVVFTYDAEAKTLKQETEYIYINYNQKDAINQEYLEWWQFVTFYAGAPVVEEPVTAPEDLLTDEWKFQTTILNLDESTEVTTNKIQVGFAGDDVYFYGIANVNLWVKATRNAEGQYVVPALQYMGEVGFFAKTKYYFTAFDENGAFVDAVFTFDAEAQSFTTDQKLVLNKSKNELLPMFTFVGPTSIFKPQPVIVDALPYTNALTVAEGEDVFTIINANGDNSTWRFESDRASIGWSSSAEVPHDDWLISPAIKLEAGKTYKFSIDAFRTSTSGTEAFEVKLAVANTAEALAAGTQVIDNQNIEPTEATAYTNDAITVAETGYYYFGIHATSPGDQYGFSVQNFKVEEGEAQAAGLASGTYYTVGGKFYRSSQNSWQDATADMPTVEVTVDGSAVSIKGLAYWFKDGAIQGAMEGNTITFASGQLVGTDQYGDEFLVGSNDGETVSDIVFVYDPVAKTLTSTTSFIVESAAADAVEPYCYWLNAVYSAEKPADPELVKLPEGAELVEYVMNSTNYNGEAVTTPAAVAVVGDEVFIKGFSTYMPDALIKGTKAGNTVTFPAKQYLGTYSGYDCYFETEAVFTYDPETESYTATGQVYSLLAGRYIDVYATNPVLTKVTEIAAVPATPSIASIEGSQYGDIMRFNVPLVDVNGNNMLAAKLSYQFFIDDENTPMVFTPEYFTKLTENMTVIPYSFTDNYDIYADRIYLNMPHDTWKKIGIQSIYTGGGVENKSEIFWFNMPEGPVTAPEGLLTEAYMFKANAKEYNQDGDIDRPDYNLMVQVGFDGDDAYIQGLSPDMPELWVKATKNVEGKYVIPANQYMGEYDLSQYGYVFPYYWTAVDSEGNCVDAVLDFDAETSTFTTSQTLALNGSATALDYYLLFNDVVITKFHEVAATPADPTFEKFEISDQVGYSTIYASIPTVGANGETLNTSKLFYTVWIEKNGEQQPYTFTAALYSKDFTEDVTEVPYLHDGYDVYKGGEIIYLEDDLAELQSWTKVGIQSIYKGAGETNKSTIVWSDGSITTGISGIAATSDDANAKFFDLQGRAVSGTTKGLVIKQVRDADGNVRTVKVVRK